MTEQPTEGAPKKGTSHTLTGRVTSNKMDKTVTVLVERRVRHPLYGKTMQRRKKLYVHDEANDARTGDRVRVTETRPLSKQKHWRLVSVLERAK